MNKRTIRNLLAKIQDKDPILPTIITELDEDIKDADKVGAALLILMAGVVVGVILGTMWLSGGF